MNIQSLKRFQKDDYRNAPSWFLTFLDVINSTVDTLNPLIAHGVDIDNNMLAERRLITLSHNIPVAVKLRTLTVRPSLVRVGYAAGYVGSAAITAYNTDGTYMVTVVFHGTAPTAPVLTTLVFEP